MNSDWSVIWPGDGEDKTIALVKLFAMVTLSLKVTWYALRWLPGKVNPIVPFTTSPPTNRNIAQIFPLKHFFFFLSPHFDRHLGQPKSVKLEECWRRRAALVPQLGEGWRQSARSLLKYVFMPQATLTNQSGFPQRLELLKLRHFIISHAWNDCQLIDA